MEVWKIIFLSKWVVCRFHVNLPGCIWPLGTQLMLSLPDYWHSGGREFAHQPPRSSVAERCWQIWRSPGPVDGMGDVAIGGWRNISDPVAWNKICLSCFDMHVSDRGMSSVRPHTWLHFWIVWRGVTECLYYNIYMPIMNLGSVVLVHCRKVSAWTPCASIRFDLGSMAGNIFDSMVRQVSNDTTWVSTETWYSRAT